MITDQTYKVPCIYPIKKNGKNPGQLPINEKSGKKTEPLNKVERDAEILKVTVPGSKSITNRALLLATLAQGKSVLRGVLFSDDSRHFLKCIQELGFDTRVDEESCTVEVTGYGGKVPKAEAYPYVGSAGTAARFLSAYLGVCEGVYHMDASEQMRRRPMAPLLESLKELGCEITFEGTEGYFPFTLKGHGFGTDTISVDIEHSSQFLSALLIASSLSERDMHIQVVGTHGMAYIEMTIRMMEQFGVHVTKTEDGSYVIPAGQKYTAREYQVEPDVSGACYFYGLSPLLGVPVQVKHISYDSMQGDIAFLEVLKKMGCFVKEDEGGLIVYPPGDSSVPAENLAQKFTEKQWAIMEAERTTEMSWEEWQEKDGMTAGYRGVDIDMSGFSDQAITVAALAPFAETPTTIRGIGHIRFQECDRMSAIVTELGKMGIRCEETENSITIYPGTPKGSLVETYDDHRMAMGFSLIGLRARGIVIDHPGCCKKTFENYFDCLESCIEQILTRQGKDRGSGG